MAKTGRVYVNQSISFPPELLASAKKRAQNLGLPFSTYVQKCVERDLKDRQPIVFAEEPERQVAEDAPASSRTRRSRG